MTATLDNPMTALEVKHGIYPIEDLVEQSGAVIDRVADLMALHKSDKVWDAHRKMILMGIRSRIRGQLVEIGKGRVTEAQLDEMAHVDPDYIEYMTQTLIQRSKMIRAEEEHRNIERRINRGQAVVKLIGPGGRNG